MEMIMEMEIMKVKMNTFKFGESEFYDIIALYHKTDYVQNNIGNG